MAASEVVVAVTAAPSASAEPVAMCTSDVIDGVEVDTYVGNPNANTVTDVPGVNVDFEFTFGSGSGVLVRRTGRRPVHVPRSIESKTLSDCSNGSEVTPSSFPKG